MSKESVLNIIFGGASHRLTSHYGQRVHPVTKKKSFHYGVDYGCSKVPLFAIESGTVYKRGYDKSAGNYLYIKYPRLGVAVAYFHLSKINVKSGQSVGKGTKVAVAGTTGSSTGVHLHIGVRNLSTWKWVNPETWLANYSAGRPGKTYKVGSVYTLQANLKVRTGPGTSYKQKKRSELTKDGQSNAKSGTYAVLKSGTKVTCKEVKGEWMRTPSGWLCTKQGGIVYIK